MYRSLESSSVSSRHGMILKDLNLYYPINLMNPHISLPMISCRYIHSDWTHPLPFRLQTKLCYPAAWLANNLIGQFNLLLNKANPAPYSDVYLTLVNPTTYHLPNQYCLYSNWAAYAVTAIYPCFKDLGTALWVELSASKRLYGERKNSLMTAIHVVLYRPVTVYTHVLRFNRLCTRLISRKNISRAENNFHEKNAFTKLEV